MARPWSINNPHPEHRPTVIRFNRGNNYLGRPTYGTQVRCSCGWDRRINEGPPSKTGAMVNRAYRDHLGGNACIDGRLVFIAGVPTCANCRCTMMTAPSGEWVHGASADPYARGFYSRRGH